MAAETRRVHERFEIELPITLVTDGRDVRGVTKNVSLGGLFMLSTERVVIGTSAKLRLRLPALKEDAEVPVTIRWTTSEGIGVQFGSLRALEVWALNQLFKKK